MVQQLPRIHLKGTAEEIGWQHGRQIRERIRETWKFYSQILFGNRLEDLKNMGNSYLDSIYDFSTSYGKGI